VTTLNLGILAHVDAGKTTLAERLLHIAGVIDEVGSVDADSTQTDTLALERQRGITIRSAVVAFTIDDVTVNLIDTPGHSDFIAEVERALCVLDGAVLVVSAVEGVQAQSRVLMRALHRLRIPTLVFVNKVDRVGADADRVLHDVAKRLSPAVVAMGSVERPGTRDAGFRPHDDTDPAFLGRLTELLADHDEVLLAAGVDTPEILDAAWLRAALAAQSGQALLHPVFFGSAATGAGVTDLFAALPTLLPAREGGADDGPLSGTVFKVEPGTAGERVAYVRMFSGALRVRDRVQLGRAGPGKVGPARAGPGKGGQVTAIRVFDHGTARATASVTAGHIARVWGLGAVQIGDTIGVPHQSGSAGHHFDAPSLETVVEPSRRDDRGVLHAALTQLAEQDPLINLRQDDVRHELSVSLYGEVQKEVIQAMLAADYGVDVTFRETTTICVERPVGSGAAVEVIDTDTNPFLATVGLRVDPAPVASGVQFGVEVEPGSMPPAFFTAVEQSVRDTLLQGIHGWEVVDCTVAMTHSGYWARQSHSHGAFDASMSSTAGDFRKLTPLVLMAALAAAGTRVLEPLHRFELEVPDDTIGATLSALSAFGAVPLETDLRDTAYVLTGEIAAARVHDLRQALPSMSRGEGVLVSAFARYEPVRGPVPSRVRTDHDPFDRRAYLLRVARGA